MNSECATERRSSDVDVNVRDKLQMYGRSLNLTYKFDVQVRLDPEVDIQFECSMSDLKYRSWFELRNASIKVVLLFDSATERKASDLADKCIILESDNEL